MRFHCSECQPDIDDNAQDAKDWICYNIRKILRTEGNVNL